MEFFLRHVLPEHHSKCGERECSAWTDWATDWGAAAGTAEIRWPPLNARTNPPFLDHCGAADIKSGDSQPPLSPRRLCLPRFCRHSFCCLSHHAPPVWPRRHESPPGTERRTWGRPIWCRSETATASDVCGEYPPEWEWLPRLWRKDKKCFSRKMCDHFVITPDYSVKNSDS